MSSTPREVPEGPHLHAYGTSPDDLIPLPTDRPLRIGRGVGNDLLVLTDTVSRFHCEIEVRLGTVIIRDLGSHNGTWVDGHRIAHEAVLHNGAVVALGQDSPPSYRLVWANGSIKTPTHQGDGAPLDINVVEFMRRYTVDDDGDDES